MCCCFYIIFRRQNEQSHVFLSFSCFYLGATAVTKQVSALQVIRHYHRKLLCSLLDTMKTPAAGDAVELLIRWFKIDKPQIPLRT